MINASLFNSEAWHGISSLEEELLERVDNALLRGLLKSHAKIPTEALHLETGTISVKYILKSRRLGYLQNILKKDEEELVSEIYNAQKNSPHDGDFCKLVEMDKALVNLTITDSEISNMKVEQYKNKVKSKVRNAAFSDLLIKKVSHSKMDDVSYDKLELQEYMRSPLFDKESVAMLLALRTRTVRGIKNDFRGMFPDVLCPLGCGETDTLKNVLSCSVLRNNCESVTMHEVKFDDIFSPDITKQKQITQLYIQLMDIREKIINNSPE